MSDFIPDTSWNILFSMSFLNSFNLRFPNIRFHEDIAFGALYYPYIQRIAIISDLTYYYLIRYDSLMNLQHRELIGTNEVSETYYVYVDKTQKILELAKTEKCYFLSRPRRFGKSLTLSTLEAMFQGKAELFKGLYAEE